MKCCFAPMEGITGYVYRNAHCLVFDHIDTYYTPFITPTQTRRLTSKETNDVLPEHNQGMHVIPQILTNKASDLLWAAEKMKELGYDEVNLNLGCPSGTVVSKNRGSGFLAMTTELDHFLEAACEGIREMEMKFSVKTRIGKTDPEEFEELLEIFNKYSLESLIVHPRIRTDYYKNKPNFEVFEKAVRESKNPLVYNGDIFSVEDFRVFHERFPTVEKIMLGRGLLANPALAGMILDASQEAQIVQSASAQKKPVMNSGLDSETLRRFHDAVLKGYCGVISGDRNVLFKMKELWNYMGDAFADGDRYVKKIRKAQHMEEYKCAVAALFAECPIAEIPGFRGWR